MTYPPSVPTPVPRPLDLPALVMRRAGMVAVVVLVLAVLAGLWRMGDDIDDEANAAMALAEVVARLGPLAWQGDAASLQELAGLQRAHPVRHLVLHVQDDQGRVLLAPPPPVPTGWLLGRALAWHQQWFSVPDGRQVSWALPRPDGSNWTVVLAASHESERREAMRNLLGMLSLLLLAVGALLAAMHWNVRRALAPLGRLLAAIADIGEHPERTRQALPPMPVDELESVAAALRELGQALDTAQRQRQVLSQQLASLQEDERGRLARELHDEFGQRLTALRVDATWLSRRLAHEPASLTVVQGMASQCAQVQQDIRALLARLQPLGPDLAANGDQAPQVACTRLAALLQDLVASWHNPGRDDGLLVSLQLPWSDLGPSAWHTLSWPRPLALTIYRLSQEALTNVARHAQARHVQVSLRWAGAVAAGQAGQLSWAVTDDGRGAADPQACVHRGSGLAGMRDRAWSQGATLSWSVASVDTARPAARPGWQVQASFDTVLLAWPHDQTTLPQDA